ncbi:hypothetical protein [Hafnia paralvei]|nr:hypothetical protein [Hafnia paralvei]
MAAISTGSNIIGHGDTESNVHRPTLYADGATHGTSGQSAEWDAEL